MEDNELGAKAEAYVKENKKKLVAQLTDTSVFPPVDIPLSAFMAGSPGAGKTEFSRNLVEDFKVHGSDCIVQIDADEMRALMPGYDGGNSSAFQKSVTRLVEEVHHAVLKNGQSFVLDGTMPNYEKAAENVRRSLDRRRVVFVFYIYQEPEVAWRFTKAREIVEGRSITHEVFARKFVAARENVTRLREEFGEEVTIFLVKKNVETHKVDKVAKIERGGTSVATHLGRMYTEDEILSIIRHEED